MEKSKILIIYTGGTIGMIEDPNTGALNPFDFDHLQDHIPELNKLDVDLTVVSIEHPIDSSNVSPDTWFQLVTIIGEYYEIFDGFVILHGSDTMAYSASALSFLLEHVNKPIIFTGSQLPIGKIRTDGKENLITAIEIAAAKENGHPIVPEVAIYFEYSLYRGNRTTKVSSENFEAFQSPNYPLLAEAGVHIKYNRFAINKVTEHIFFVRQKICTDVASIRIFPGLQREVFQAISRLPQLKGLIIETFGSGNTPTHAWLSEEIMLLNQREVIVVNVTQCTTGAVSQGKYETGVHLERAGVLSGRDITFEAAILKLMYLLACDELSFEERKIYMERNIRGEMSNN
ncbi:MAG: asparaginase [Flavobacteriales bacterium]|nr:asparaginase [Flavobacteriales bacterium]